MLMMLPFEAPTIFEGIHKSFFRMPRVVKNQRAKFENEDLYRNLSHESAVKYTGLWSRSKQERQLQFIAGCHEGHTEISFVQNGNQFNLIFNPNLNPAYDTNGCDFQKEVGKVHIKSGFILNGVCVIFRGWISIETLEGFGSLEYDEGRAYLEETQSKQQFVPNSLTQAQLQTEAPPTLPSSISSAAAAAALMSNPFKLYNYPLGPPPPQPPTSTSLPPPVGGLPATATTLPPPIGSPTNLPSLFPSTQLTPFGGLPAHWAMAPPPSTSRTH